MGKERFDLGLEELITFGKHWKIKESFACKGKGSLGCLGWRLMVGSSE